ncbi:DUF1513 domain-containing protein [Oceaniglobus roseus]|uniref:DUF1513 domain-containing protein n=1 Tax=Oceaniglobus roseus TaxID=1737570 RepID=UPI000C7ED4AD|nr:DUF1513 domain-containing protein [Kandeliimicrobium roseum]
MHRRKFLGAALAAASAPAVGWAAAGDPSYLAAAKEADGGYALFGLDAAGADIFRIPLPARGHAATAHSAVAEAVAFARRPGTFALVIDCATGREKARLTAPEGRHFYGHGTFIEGGTVLATTENDIATGQGRIGFWSRADGYMRIGEVATHGIGPHDIRTMPDGSLVVANGGILTDPKAGDGREKLNLDTMQPNLAFLTAGGTLTDLVELEPELHQNSIRHLAVARDGTVAFAMQWEGDPDMAPPLLGLVKRGEDPRLLAAPYPEHVGMRGYAGSIAFDTAGSCVAITSPKGGRVHRFDREGFLDAPRRADVCGIATAEAGLIATDGFGGVLWIDGAHVQPLQAAHRAWDNHLIRIG